MMNIERLLRALSEILGERSGAEVEVRIDGNN